MGDILLMQSRRSTPIARVAERLVRCADGMAMGHGHNGSVGGTVGSKIFPDGAFGRTRGIAAYRPKRNSAIGAGVPSQTASHGWASRMGA